MTLHSLTKRVSSRGSNAFFGDQVVMDEEEGKERIELYIQVSVSQ
jgi:hypothetical protein